MTGIEKRGFTRFLAAPYYNQRPELERYWRFFLEDYGKKGVKYRPESIFERLYPGSTFDAKQFRHCNSWLLKKIEQFLVVRKNEGATFEYHLTLAKVYREKKLDTLFSSNLTAAKKSVLVQPMEPKKFLNAYQLEYEQYIYDETLKRTATNNLQGLGDSLDQYLIISKLKQSCLMLAHQSVYHISYDFSFLNMLLTFLKGNPLLQNPAIGLYYHCYRAFSENDTVHFKDFKKLLIDHQSTISFEETSNLLLFALNFCIRKINEGDAYFSNEAWDFYLLGLDQKLFYDQGYLGRFTYKNIVALGIKLKRFDWSSAFIEDYKKDLNPKYQQNYFNYNKAQLYFSQNKYHLAMPLIAMLDDSDLLLNFDAKVILIKMYYELNEWEALYSLLDSFNVMIQRKKVIGYHKNYYKDLIRLTKQLMELAPGENKNRESLREKILTKDKFPEKEWFLKMVEA